MQTINKNRLVTPGPPTSPLVPLHPSPVSVNFELCCLCHLSQLGKTPTQRQRLVSGTTYTTAPVT